MKTKRLAVIILLSLSVLIFLPVLTVQAQTGWNAQFYPNDTATGTDFITIANYQTTTSSLAFNFGTGFPTTNGAVGGTQIFTDPTYLANPTAPYSARFTSTQTLGGGTYQINVTYSLGVRIKINNAVVLDRFSTGTGIDSLSVTIPGGATLFEIEYRGANGNASQNRLSFQYTPLLVTPGAGTPGAFVTPATPIPTATPIPPLTASVTGVRGLAVRTGPYPGASLVTVARPDQAYPILGRNNGDDPFPWYLVQVGDKQGFISSRYTSITDAVERAPVVGHVFDTIDNPPDTGVTAITRSYMNLRQRPSTRSAILADIEWGASMPLLGRTVTGAMDRWYQVRYNGQVGWIFAPYVTVRGNIRDVPIR